MKNRIDQIEARMTMEARSHRGVARTAAGAVLLGGALALAACAGADKNRQDNTRPSPSPPAAGPGTTAPPAGDPGTMPTPPAGPAEVAPTPPGGGGGGGAQGQAGTAVTPWVAPSLPSAAPARDVSAPLVLGVEGPAAPAAGQDIEVILRIRRVDPALGPLDLAVRLPEGVSLAGGAVRETIDDKTATEITRALKLRLGVLPGQDLVVTVDVRGEGYGVHAEQAYRFGRPAPRLPQPHRPGVGPGVGPGEGPAPSLGRPVRMAPPSH